MRVAKRPCQYFLSCANGDVLRNRRVNQHHVALRVARQCGVGGPPVATNLIRSLSLRPMRVLMEAMATIRANEPRAKAWHIDNQSKQNKTCSLLRKSLSLFPLLLFELSWDWSPFPHFFLSVYLHRRQDLFALFTLRRHNGPFRIKQQRCQRFYFRRFPSHCIGSCRHHFPSHSLGTLSINSMNTLRRLINIHSLVKTFYLHAARHLSTPSREIRPVILRSKLLLLQDASLRSVVEW